MAGGTGPLHGRPRDDSEHPDAGPRSHRRAADFTATRPGGGPRQAGRSILWRQPRVRRKSGYQRAPATDLDASGRRRREQARRRSGVRSPRSPAPVRAGTTISSETRWKSGWLRRRAPWVRCWSDTARSRNRRHRVETLRNAALALRRDGDENGARSVLEFLYDREIHNGHLEAANFLGLAEVKLAAQRHRLGGRAFESHGAGGRRRIRDLAARRRIARQVRKNRGSRRTSSGGASKPCPGMRRPRCNSHGRDARVRPPSARQLLDRGRRPTRRPRTHCAPKPREWPRRSRSRAFRAPSSRFYLRQPSSPEAAAKPYQVEARIEAARQVAERRNQASLVAGGAGHRSRR